MSYLCCHALTQLLGGTAAGSLEAPYPGTPSCEQRHTLTHPAWGGGEGQEWEVSIAVSLLLTDHPLDVPADSCESH